MVLLKILLWEAREFLDSPKFWPVNFSLQTVGSLGYITPGPRIVKYVENQLQCIYGFTSKLLKDDSIGL